MKAEKPVSAVASAGRLKAEKLKGESRKQKALVEAWEVGGRHLTEGYVTERNGLHGKMIVDSRKTLSKSWLRSSMVWIKKVTFYQI